MLVGRLLSEPLPFFPGSGLCCENSSCVFFLVKPVVAVCRKGLLYCRVKGCIGFCCVWRCVLTVRGHVVKQKTWTSDPFLKTQRWFKACLHRVDRLSAGHQIVLIHSLIPYGPMLLFLLLSFSFPLNQVAFCSPAAVLITCFSTAALLPSLLFSGNKRIYWQIDLVCPGLIPKDSIYLCQKWWLQHPHWFLWGEPGLLSPVPLHHCCWCEINLIQVKLCHYYKHSECSLF